MNRERTLYAVVIAGALLLGVLAVSAVLIGDNAAPACPDGKQPIVAPTGVREHLQWRCL